MSNATAATAAVTEDTGMGGGVAAAQEQITMEADQVLVLSAEEKAQQDALFARVEALSGAITQSLDENRALRDRLVKQEVAIAIASTAVIATGTTIAVMHYRNKKAAAAAAVTAAEQAALEG